MYACVLVCMRVDVLCCAFVYILHVFYSVNDAMHFLSIRCTVLFFESDLFKIL